MAIYLAFNVDSSSFLVSYFLPIICSMYRHVHTQSCSGIAYRKMSEKKRFRTEDKDGGTKKTAKERARGIKKRRAKPAACRQRYRALAKRKQKGDRHLALLLSLSLGPILKWSHLSVNNLLQPDHPSACPYLLSFPSLLYSSLFAARLSLFSLMRSPFDIATFRESRLPIRTF